MKKTREEIIEYINSLRGYEGYVQFSDRRIEDIFTKESNISVDAKDGFVYEAHFCNGTESIAIKQLNDAWYVSEHNITSVAKEDREILLGINELKVEMAQIWKEQEDPLCEGMKVKKLDRTVFVGFIKGEDS